MSIAEGSQDLKSFVSLFKKTAISTKVDAGKRKVLLKILLEVYMHDEYSSVGAERAARLMESQGMNLDTLDVSPFLCEVFPSILCANCGFDYMLDSAARTIELADTFTKPVRDTLIEAYGA